MERPVEEELDVIIGPGDPRFAVEREAWTLAARKAQSLHSADELLAGVADDDWHVRYESIDRLKGRWHDHDRTFPVLAELAERDSKWHVRGKALTALLDFDRDEVASIAERAMQDPSTHVRWDANVVLYQLGLTKSLPDYPD
jgi:HEAT repeats